MGTAPLLADDWLELEVQLAGLAVELGTDRAAGIRAFAFKHYITEGCWPVLPAPTPLQDGSSGEQAASLARSAMEFEARVQPGAAERVLVCVYQAALVCS